jgi:hypothetical protein
VTFIFLFNVVSLVIYKLVFEVQQIVDGFWFFGLLFCGVGWFDVCVGVALCFVGKLCYSGQHFVKK